jgi:hypothetical protein
MTVRRDLEVEVETANCRHGRQIQDEFIELVPLYK